MSTTKTTQERAEIDAASEPAAVDCRKCVHGYDIREGVSVTCAIRARSSGTTPVPWDDVADGVCSDWRERPASPPVSADREGPDLLEAAQDVLERLDALAPGDTGDKSILARRLRRAITAEEARRARPAQWSHVWRCSGCGEMRPEQGVVDPRWLWTGSVWDHQCDASHREPARDFGPAVEDPRDALLKKCATALASLGAAAHGERVLAVAHGHLNTERAAAASERLCAETLAALRDAGVEPTPEAQEGTAQP